MNEDIASHVAALRLIDCHAHGFWISDVDRRQFENGLNEANTEPLSDFDSAFDTQIGFAVRAHCSALLDLPAHCEPHQYWDRRTRYRPAELAQLFMSAAGVSDWLVDTGLSSGVAGIDEMSQVAPGIHEIIRVEQIAEQAVVAGGDYTQSFRGILDARAASAVATKTVLAYRGGFDGDLSQPSDAEVNAAAAKWRDAGGKRVTDQVLLRFGLHEALRLGKPLQMHVGLGDRDCDLHRTNPLLLLDFLRTCGKTPVVLLHCYPFEREAGYLAQAFNHVFMDIGLTINHLGARAEAFIARSMELAPFRKLLYSSDGFGPPELHYVSARLWRDGISAVLGGFVAREEWSAADAVRVATLIGRDNAIRLYGL